MALLLDLKTHVEAHGSVSLQDLSNRFDRPPEALRGMLDHWVRKGMLRHDVLSTACGGCKPSSGCSSCDAAAGIEIYSTP